MASQEWCMNHPDSPATVHCRQCGKTICDACSRNVPEGRFCSDGCVKRHREFQETSGAVMSAGKSGALGKLIAILVVLAVAAAVAWKMGWLPFGK